MNQHPARHILTDGYLIYLCLVTAIQVAGISSMSPILPALARQFEVENHVISLTIIMLTVPAIIFTPVSGILADRIGRKPVLITCLLLTLWYFRQFVCTGTKF